MVVLAMLQVVCMYTGIQSEMVYLFGVFVICTVV
jgi:hypothetical protein